MNVLVDTSVWSWGLRRRRGTMTPQEVEQEARLRELIQEGRVVLIGPVRQELLSGIRDAAVLERLRDLLRTFEDAGLESTDYEEAASFFNRCCGFGVTASPVDFLICAAASRRGLSIFTADGDLTRLAGYLPIELFQV